MLRGMTMMQFQRWRWFSELEPFGERRQDFRFASIVQALSNIHRDSKKRPSAFRLEECVVTFGEPEEATQNTAESTEGGQQQGGGFKPSWKAMKDYANIIVKAFNKGRR